MQQCNDPHVEDSSSLQKDGLDLTKINEGLLQMQPHCQWYLGS